MSADGRPSRAEFVAVLRDDLVTMAASTVVCRDHKGDIARAGIDSALGHARNLVVFLLNIGRRPDVHHDDIVDGPWPQPYAKGRSIRIAQADREALGAFPLHPNSRRRTVESSRRRRFAA